MSSHILLRDIPATTIPTGERCILPSGAAVDITQTLGGNVTVRVDRGLYRIEREHTEAISGIRRTRRRRVRPPSLPNRRSGRR